MRAVGVDHDRGVVVDAFAAALEERRDDDHAVLGGQLRERLAARAGDRLGQVEVARVLALAEVARAEELGQAGDARAIAPGRVQFLERPREVGRRVGFHPQLHQRDPHGHGGSKDHWPRYGKG